LLQGCAGGLITPQISGAIHSLFRGQERGTAFGLFGTIVGISTAIGPLLGGALIALFGAHTRPLLFPIAAVLPGLWVLNERRYGRRPEPLVSLDLLAIRSR
jgi:MFS family permease